jgi:hypothetical protein
VLTRTPHRTALWGSVPASCVLYIPKAQGGMPYCTRAVRTSLGRVPCGAPQVAGLVAYDFVFFWLHVGMHLLPRVGRAVGHSQHHDFDGKRGGGGAASETAFQP